MRGIADAYMDPSMMKTLNHGVLTAEEERELTRGLYEINERLAAVGHEIGIPPESNTLSDSFRRAEYINKLRKHSNGYREEVDFLETRGDNIIDELVKFNQRFVHSIAKKYKTPGLPIEDLMQAGNMGLLRAILKFDYRLGYKLSTYTYRPVRYAVLHVLKNHSRQRNVMFTDITEDADFLIAETTPDPKAVSPPLEAENMEDMGRIPDMLSELSETESGILISRYGLWGNEKKTLEEVGRTVKLTKERVRQIQNKAIKKLQKPSVAE